MLREATEATILKGQVVKHAVIYDRASSSKQEDNYSREDAKRVGIQIAESNGFTWEYIKEIGSGKNLSGRPALLAILDRIASQEIQAIIVQDLDRLARPDEAADFETIKNICVQSGVIVFTQSGAFDWRNSDDKLMGRIKMAFSGYEREQIIKRIVRGLKERAKKGRYNGGRVPIGYDVKYKLLENGERKSWIEIDESQKELVEKIFDTYIKHGAYGAATRLNKQGYTGKRGGSFYASTIEKIITNPMFAGYMSWGKNKQSQFLANFEATMVYRPELQIISLEKWERAQDVYDNRQTKNMAPGKWGKYLFTGFLACQKCGGPMHGKKDTYENVSYACSARHHNGKGACDGPNHSHKLVAKAIIPLVAKLFSEGIGVDNILQEGAENYGKTITEAELERQLQAELHTTKEKRDRLIESVSEGVIELHEAKGLLEKLRAKIGRIERQLDNIEGKAKVREKYLEAMDALRGMDIEQVLWDMEQNDVPTLRQLFDLIFKPVTLQVNTYRVKGRQYDCDILNLEYTEAFEDTTILYTTLHRYIQMYVD